MKLSEILKEITRLSKKYNLAVANGFHAGDGNLHPLILFDGSKKEELKKNSSGLIPTVLFLKILILNL